MEEVWVRLRSTGGICGKCFALDGTDYSLKEDEESLATKNFCELGESLVAATWKKFGYAYGQPGISLAVNGNGSYAVGGPGALEWRGSVFYQELKQLDIFEQEQKLWQSIVNAKFPN